ncbi:SagB/ThcOx family dehydrogenase [Cohnella sp. CFH 77786]|uniref:SagB family peptide dehydrogenase n=1 Tax=Cohnella sp. CFH 77786 TaxID=2662265 RepID=UPI001C6086A1|nr:SagB family peptide dehydrogenase [Cohnella sp. CFH 77786]MBW5446310.1 SagB/ThcOx family dehydrogenase [Cohnella sp. CFH 77786]
MDIARFLHELHFETDKAKPIDWEPDWEDAPLPFKLYRRLPYYPLSLDVPLTFAALRGIGKPGVRELGHLLWYAYGTATASRAAVIPGQPPNPYGLSEWYRRVVPSGGGLYPNELYAYLKLPELPDGVYHYDAARHRLVLLREGNYDSYVERAVGGRLDASGHFGVLFVTAFFWKNFFKYHDFSYRLQGLDAGVLIGQLLEAGKGFGFGASVHYQFLDRAAGHLLGLRENEESVYAVIPMASEPERQSGRRTGAGSSVLLGTSEELIREIPPLFHEHYVRSKRVKAYPRLIRMNEASMQHSTADFRIFRHRRAIPKGFRRIPLPRVEVPAADAAALSRKRYSPETDFVLRRVGGHVLAGILRQTATSFRYVSDLDEGEDEAPPRVFLCGCFHGVEGVRDGAYLYDHAAHALAEARPGDQRAWLQYGLTFPNVNLYQVPMVFHAAGDRLHAWREWGARGYRIQQMEAGILVQKLLLAIARTGMAGRPLLGYDAYMADALFRLSELGQTALIQIPAGPYRYRHRYEGSLHG